MADVLSNPLVVSGDLSASASAAVIQLSGGAANVVGIGDSGKILWKDGQWYDVSLRAWPDGNPGTLKVDFGGSVVEKVERSYLQDPAHWISQADLEAGRAAKAEAEAAKAEAEAAKVEADLEAEAGRAKASACASAEARALMDLLCETAAMAIISMAMAGLGVWILIQASQGHSVVGLKDNGRWIVGVLLVLGGIFVAVATRNNWKERERARLGRW